MSDLDMSVAGDGDKWMLLERVSGENLPIVVRSRINSDIAEFSESAAIVAVICDVNPDSVNDNGMPTCMPELYEVEDEIVGLVAGTGFRAFHTASATGDARRVIYFAVETGADISSAVSSVTSPSTIISAFDDIDFETYLGFTAPSDLDKQIDGDRQVIAALEEHGDQLGVPRTVEFFFYGQRPSLISLIDEASGQGFVLGTWLDENGGVMLHREMPVEASDFWELTPYLIDVSERLGINYDGWGTPIAAADPPQVNLEPPKSSLLARLFGSKKN